jgi:phytanoyl-CoA hydroxylase
MAACLKSVASLDIKAFQRDGFVVVRNLLDMDLIKSAASRVEPVFFGEFETGIQPDKWKWRGGIDDEGAPRGMNNVWKSDKAFARLVLDEKLGENCAKLMNWAGARLEQDFLIWKAPDTPKCEVAFHQDDSYQDWIMPSNIISCWIALDDTDSNGGTLEYVRGSHLWGLSNRVENFHRPKDYKSDLKKHLRESNIEQPIDIVSINVPAGTGVFHHGRVWHGSGENRSNRHRRSITAHVINSETTFHSSVTSPVFSHYKVFGSDKMDESFFPIIWGGNSGRSDFLADYLST